MSATARTRLRRSNYHTQRQDEGCGSRIVISRVEQVPSVFTIYGNVRWQPSIILRMCDQSAGIGFLNHFSIENSCYSACSQAAVETVIHQTFAEPCVLRSKWWRQAAHRHQTCGPDDCGRANQRSGSTNEDASSRYQAVVMVIRNYGRHGTLHMEGWRADLLHLPSKRPHPTFVETTLPQRGRLVKARQPSS